MSEEMKTEETRRAVALGPAFAKAFAKAQGLIKGAVKDKTNPAFANSSGKGKYADLEAAFDACREPLAANGFSVIQHLETKQNSVTCRTILLHESGDYDETPGLSLPVLKTDAHGFGSACTYARRFDLCAQLGIAPTDDDGNASVGVGEKEKQAPLGVEKLKKAVTQEAPHEDAKPNGKERTHQAVTFRYGNAKSKTSFEVDDKSLDWYIEGATKAVADPDKAKFLAANTHELSLLQAEARWRAGVGQ